MVSYGSSSSHKVVFFFPIDLDRPGRSSSSNTSRNRTNPRRGEGSATTEPGRAILKVRDDWESTNMQNPHHKGVFGASVYLSMIAYQYDFCVFVPKICIDTLKKRFESFETFDQKGQCND